LGAAVAQVLQVVFGLVHDLTWPVSASRTSLVESNRRSRPSVNQKPQRKLLVAADNTLYLRRHAHRSRSSRFLFLLSVVLKVEAHALRFSVSAWWHWTLFWSKMHASPTFGKSGGRSDRDEDEALVTKLLCHGVITLSLWVKREATCVSRGCIVVSWCHFP